MNLEKLIPSDPAKHFGFAQCKNCWWTPCEQLRHGVIEPGRIELLSASGFADFDCPFIIHSIEEVESFLTAYSFFMLETIYLDVLATISIDERFNNNPDFFVSEYLDARGRIDYILHLINQNVLIAIGIPYGFERDQKMRKWLFAYEYAAGLPGGTHKQMEEEDDAPAVTDSMGQEKKEISISNPRWEHKNEEKKKNSPDKACFGDTIVLKADVSGIAEGSEATFNVYDSNLNPQKICATVKGKNKSGTATAEWVVKDLRQKNEDREAQIKFEASAKDKVSEMKEIPLTSKIGSYKIRLPIDPNNTEAQDDTFTLISMDDGKTYKQQKTVKDDKIPGDNYTDLEFSDVKEDAQYNFEVDSGKEIGKYFLFEKVSGKELLSDGN